MNDIVLQLKEMRRAMVSYVLTLYEIIFESKPEIVVEIGVGQAQSTRVILSALQENDYGKLISIDWKARIHKIPEVLHPYWKQITHNSHDKEALEELEKELKGKKIDILLIDGDHSYGGAKEDFEKYTPFVKEGGYILMHDTVNQVEGVKDFWKEIKYPKVNLKYGRAARGIIPGMGIIEKITE